MKSIPTAPILTVFLAALAASPVSAQVQQSHKHVHEGELGEKYLILEQKMKCECGCGLDVHTCQFTMQCGTSPVWSERIITDLESGMTPEAIEASFVSDFGLKVLMAPPAEGFNLLGYLLPATAILIAGMITGLAVRRGAGRQDDLEPVLMVSDEQEARLRAAMRKIDAEESPDW